jgi:type III pantothenate kinase
MKPAVVVDVGNTRMKWGRVNQARVRDWVALPHDDSTAWQMQINEWKINPKMSWCVAGVQPERCDALVKWLRGQGRQVTQLDSWRQLPIKVDVDKKDRVGIDRLLDGVAANLYRMENRPAIVIDAGSAVTVNLIDEEGAFRGGAILPGCGLMGQALHAFTAKLPPIQLPAKSDQLPFAPAKNTADAMQLGIFWSVVGGIVFLIVEMATSCQWKIFPQIFLTGGDALLLEPELSRHLADLKSSDWVVPAGETVHHWPTMTLEGLRLTAEALP